MNLDALATAWAPRLLSIMRIMAGLLFLQHGTAKHFKFPMVPMFAKLESRPWQASPASLKSWAACC